MKGAFTMKNKYIAAIAACAFCGCMGGMSAYAYTADDVAAKARASGWPEEVIQMGYNEWSSGAYSQDKLDAVYSHVAAWDDEVEEMVYGSFGMDPPARSPEPAPTDAPASAGNDSGNTSSDDTTPSGGGSTSPDDTTPSGGGSGNDDSGNAAPSGSQGGKLDTVTKTDGTVEDRIPPSQFVDMSFEEKKDYVNSLDYESKKEFVADLTKEERNSMLKQMPVEDKAALMQTYIDVAGEMGVNVTVDSLSEDNISLTIRDESGKVIDKAAVGVTIDETGISHTKPLLFALGGTLLAVLGFGGLYYYIRRTES